MKLWDFQQDLVEEVRQAIRSGYRRILIVAPTGSGKTVIGAHILHSAEQKRSQSMFMAHRRELVQQTARKLQAFGVEHGIIMSGVQMRTWLGTQIASIDTLRARYMHKIHSLDDKGQSRQGWKRDKPEIDIVMVDEAHRACSPTYTFLLDEYKDNAISIGLTATPVRGDGKGLGRHYDYMVLAPSMGDLIDKDYLVPPRYYAPSIPDLTGVKVQRGDYVEGQLQKVMDQRESVGDIVTNWQRICPDRKTIVFATGVRHSIHIAEQFCAAGVAAEHVDGTTPIGDREAILDRLRSGETQVISNCMVLCLDEKTEILTDRGWTNYQEMTKDHGVANWDRGQVWFEEPLDIVVRDRDPSEKMFSIKTPKKSIRVTSKHRMLYRTKRGGRFLKASVDELEGRDVELPINGTYNVAAADVTLDECVFAGFFVGDGCRCELQRGGVEYVVSQSWSYPKIIEWFDRLVDRCGFHCVRRDKKNYSVSHVRWSFCRGTGGKSQKRSGGLARIEWLLDKSCSRVSLLNENQFRAFMSGLWMADGNHGDGVTKVKNKHITACNKEMLDNLQATAVVRGMRASLSSEILPRKAGHRSQWVLSFGYRQSCFTSGSTFVRERVWRPEKVWCVKTSSRNIITRRRGKVVVMGNTEGFDCPDLSCCIVVRPTRNVGLFIQMAGRVLRSFPGKKDAVIIDHSGNIYEHGFLEDDHGWRLSEADGSKSREERQKDLTEKKPITCVNCAHVYTGQLICPNCGHTPEKRGEYVETRHADLMEIRREKAAKDANKKKEYTKEDKQLWYSMFYSYALSKGHKEGSVAHKYREKFGVWPKDMVKVEAEPTPECLSYIQHLNIKNAHRRKAEARSKHWHNNRKAS